MKNLFIALFVLAIGGCQVKDKIVEDEAKSLILRAMVNGQWIVTNYNKFGNDQTPGYKDYTFQFRENGTVEAIRYGNTEITGNWSASGDTQAQYISATFTNGSSSIQDLVGTWKVKDAAWTSVEVQQVTSQGVIILKLTKQ